MTARHMLGAALVLTLFAMAGTALVASTYQHTRKRIARNERLALLRNLQELVPKDRYDNDPVADTIEVTDPQWLGTAKPVTVYRARKAGKPVAVVFAPVAPDGYNGAIRLLVAIDADGTLAGVRVLSEHETPGLGDNIEPSHTNWIFGFTGRSLHNPPDSKWKVKKDGGVFDQFTGATITPRAVVGAVHRALVYFSHHEQRLFAAARRKESGHG